MSVGEFRLRVRYRKSGRLRFLSHLEVARAIERSARRAGLAYAVSRGFNPRMKVSFGPALPVGTEGLREYVDLWLTEYLPAGEAVRLLAGSTPEDLAPGEARYVASELPSLAARLTIARYEVMVALGKETTARDYDKALREVVAAGTLVVPHKGRQKVFDLARTLPEEPRVEIRQNERAVVQMTIRIGPNGALRPEYLANAALERHDLDGAVVSVARTDILEETEDGWRRPV